jgi:hypothetical protein
MTKEEIEKKLEIVKKQYYRLDYKYGSTHNELLYLREIKTLLSQLHELEHKKEPNHCRFCDKFCGFDHCPFAK